MLLSSKHKNRILSANNSTILPKKEFSKKNKNFFDKTIFSMSTMKSIDQDKKRTIFSNKIKQYKIEKHKQRINSSHISQKKNISFDFKYLNKKNIPANLNVLNLIVKKSASDINIKLIENKIRRLKRLSDLNKLDSSTKQKLFEYNIIYGHNTNNLIRSYTTKLIQLNSEVKKNLNNNDNIQIFSEEEIINLFYQKCKDLNVPIKEELMNRFINFIKEKCINRVINLTECCLGFNSMIVLTEILSRNPQICSRLILTKNDFGDDGIELLLESLKGNDNIVELNLSSNSLGPNGGMEVFHFLLEQNSIICIDLSSKEGLYRNRICAEGIRLITQVLQKNFFLEKIDLSSNSIKNEGLKYIINGLKSNMNLQSLIIPNNEINEKGILYMENKLQTCKLKHLNISSNPIGNNGLISLGICLAGDQLNEIISLNISECSITFDAFFIFIKKISKNQKIQILTANKNDLSSNNKWHILDDFFKKLSLRNLSLGSCHLNKDMKEIADIFKFNPTIKYLDLSHNQITDENFESFQSYPKDNLILEELDLSRNYISDRSALIFFQNLADNTNILKLNFFDNHLENTSASAIIDILKINKHILNININCNRIGLKVLNQIKNQIKNNKIIEKGKYIPKLKNDIKDLEFNPDEIGYLKNKINNTNKEREYIENKFIKELKDLKIKKIDNLKNVKSIDILEKKIEKNIDNLKYEWNYLREEEIKEKENLNKGIIEIKEKINAIEDEINNLNYIKYNLKHKYNEEVGLLKYTYQQTLEKEQTSKLGILSLNNKIKEMNNEYKQKLDYLNNLKSSLLNMKKKSSKVGIISNNRYSFKKQK